MKWWYEFFCDSAFFTLWHALIHAWWLCERRVMIISIESLSMILVNTRRITNGFTIVQILSHLGDELLISVLHKGMIDSCIYWLKPVLIPLIYSHCSDENLLKLPPDPSIIYFLDILHWFLIRLIFWSCLTLFDAKDILAVGVNKSAYCKRRGKL